MASLRKRLEKVFWKEQISLSECKGVLNDYLSRTVDEGTKALMHLAFAVNTDESVHTARSSSARFPVFRCTPSAA